MRGGPHAQEMRSKPALPPQAAPRASIASGRVSDPNPGTTVKAPSPGMGALRAMPKPPHNVNVPRGGPHARAMMGDRVNRPAVQPKVKRYTGG